MMRPRTCDYDIALAPFEVPQHDIGCVGYVRNEDDLVCICSNEFRNSLPADMSGV